VALWNSRQTAQARAKRALLSLAEAYGIEPSVLWWAMARNLEDIKSKHVDLPRDALSNVEAELQTRTAAVNTLRDRLTAKQQQAELLAKEVTDLASRIDERQTEINNSEGRIAALRQQLAVLDDDLAIKEKTRKQLDYDLLMAPARSSTAPSRSIRLALAGFTLLGTLLALYLILNRSGH
jgi:uncharacterized protein (DUF3084 family)